MRRIWFIGLFLSSSVLAQGLVVGASTAIVESLVQGVSGEDVQIVTVVPPGSDPHTFEPRPSVLRELNQAQAFFAIGLGYEYWLDDLASNLPDSTQIVELGENLENLICLGEEPSERNHDHGACNPHVWLDPNLAIKMIDQIAVTLSDLEPNRAEVYRQNSRNFQEQIKAIDQETRACLAQIPAVNKKFVAQHDAFAYLSRAYGLDQVGTLATVSAQERGTQSFAKLVEKSRQERVKVVFAEPQLPKRTAETLAQEIGAQVYSLYSDALDQEVDSYLELLSHNSATICQAFSQLRTSAMIRCATSLAIQGGW